MGDDDNGHAGAAAGVLQQFENGLAGVVVQGAGGLVAEQKLWVLGQGPGDGHPLLLAAGELSREVGKACFQSHLPEHLGRIQRVAADLRGKLHIFQGRQVGNQIVELENKSNIIAAVGGQLALVERRNLLAVQDDFAAGRRVHAAENIQKGRFACAGGADNDTDFSLFNGKTDIVEGDGFHISGLIDFRQVGCFHVVLHRYFLGSLLC